jgi:hypothetical protein
LSKRAGIALGMAAGALWATLLIFAVPPATRGMFLPINVALIGAFAPPGFVMAAMIGNLARRRFFDDAIIDGETPQPHSSAEIDARVLQNTVEQALLALLLWPLIALVLGGALVVALGASFAVARLLFWVGYHISPAARAFGFAATFYPTVLGAAWAVLVWFV